MTTEGGAGGDTVKRKSEHLRINLEEDVQSKGIKTGFEQFRFRHVALPTIDLARIDLSCHFLGQRLQAPILISCMTGGVAQASRINRHLAVAAEEQGCAMGVGSQRAALENDTMAEFFRVRDIAPHVPLLANLGAVQLNYGYTVEHCRRAVEMIDAQILVLHLNPLQEALQADGNTDFSGLLPKIESVCKGLSVPVIVKEVGWGISAAVAQQLVNVGVAAIDVAGAGGTSWSEVERHRAPTALLHDIAAAFSGWGIPTADCVMEIRRALPLLPLIASGGLRNGIDVAKALALGANLAGIAGPLLRAADVSEQAAVEALRVVIMQLRVAMFCTDSHTPDQLCQDDRLYRITPPV